MGILTMLGDGRIMDDVWMMIPGLLMSYEVILSQAASLPIDQIQQNWMCFQAHFIGMNTHAYGPMGLDEGLVERRI